MKRLHKKIISGFLPIPFFFAITFCCCLGEKVFADEHHSNFSMSHHQESQEVEESHHADHQDHSEGQDECSCPKHFSFLSQPPVDITPDLSFQLLAKGALIVPAFQVFLLSFTSPYANGPPWQDYRDYASIPLFFKNSNLRI